MPEGRDELNSRASRVASNPSGAAKGRGCQRSARVGESSHSAAGWRQLALTPGCGSAIEPRARESDEWSTWTAGNWR